MKNIKKLNEIELIRDEIEKCVGCGNCLYYCPVYSENHEENYVARGRNRLLKELIDNHKDIVAGIADRFDKCILCGRCTMVCPQGVRNDLIIMAARGELVKAEGLSITKSLAFRKLLKNREYMGKTLRFASKFQFILPVTKEPNTKLNHIPLQKHSKIRHIPIFFANLRGGGQLPSIAENFLSEQVPETNPPLPNVKKRNIRVAYFSGCAAEFIFPETGRALIRILNQLGVEVVFPKKQGCCGIAVYTNGDFETAREMAIHNLEVFSEFEPDFIVTGCATCGSALKEGWLDIASGDHEKAKFKDFADRVRDISELLVELADFKPLRYHSLLPENTRVTYHDPCHLARYQGIVEQPRKILKHVFGNNFLEMDNNGCCGCGGSFNVYNYALSEKIGKKKIDSIERTHADVVINTCPGCMIQLIDGIERYHLPQRVVHMVEAIEPLY